jgi:hypothetical protein
MYVLASAGNFVRKVLLKVSVLPRAVVPLPVAAHRPDRFRLGSFSQPALHLVGRERGLKVIGGEPRLIRPVGGELDVVRSGLMVAHSEEQVDRLLLARVCENQQYNYLAEAITLDGTKEVK